MNDITYVSAGGDGHRVEYDRLFQHIFDEMHMNYHFVQEARHAKNCKNILFYSMFDSKPTRTFPALLRTITRSVLGRKTVGLFFRPGMCLHANTFRQKIKKALFQFTSRLPHVSILTILPFDVCHDFSKIATNWIYDPQLWDLHYLQEPMDSSPELARHITSVANGRRIVVALGEQNYAKGFDCMVDLWCSSWKIRKAFLFIVAGKVDIMSAKKSVQFEVHGGLIVNRRIENHELFGLYRITDIVWSCYSPEYDQASGIHGRAVQLGVPVIVRKDSYIEKLGEMFGHPALAISFDAPQKAASNLLTWQPVHINKDNRLQNIARMREHSLSVLAEAIGLVNPS